MRICIYSDLHLERSPFVPPANDADVIVLAGDIDNGAAGIEWARETFDKPVLYLAGNHEYYEGEFDAVQKALGTTARKHALELLDCSEVVVDGVRFLGCTLWTDYSLAPQAERPAVIEASRKLRPDYQLIRFGSRLLAPEDAIAFYARHRAWLAAKLGEPFPGKTVVVTHFAPHPLSIAPAYVGHHNNPGFVLDLEDLMGRAALWIHGHTHTFFDYRVRGTRVVCNPRGYPGEPTGFRPDFVVEI
ncbi:MAG TPA: metallophosphoesterase [Burkholderiales bacterium]|nr:metallophosphoesterase [Burkholderiales bacterium]